MHGSKAFAKLDTCQGYMQIELEEESRKITNVYTGDGIYLESMMLLKYLKRALEQNIGQN